MSSSSKYATALQDTQWKIDSEFETLFNWEYDEGREKLLNLYEKGKDRQWNTNTRIDWSQSVNLENPFGFSDEGHPLYGSPVWKKLSAKDLADLRLHSAAASFSQFMHGEQGALICTAKIVQTAPDIDAKFYAATQVIDEARHVETYSRYLHEKLDLIYPINPGLASLLDNVIRDSRWDITYLGMQILIEGLALAAFSGIRDQAKEPLAQALNAYVMQDEARHVAFGRLVLRDYYPQLSQKEREEREEFVVEACYHMRDRFGSFEVYRNLGYNLEEIRDYFRDTPGQADFQARIFSRIVPTIKDIGLWGPKVQQAFSNMGIIKFANLDAEEFLRQDELVADQYDARKRQMTEAVIAMGAASHN